MEQGDDTTQYKLINKMSAVVLPDMGIMVFGDWNLIGRTDKKGSINKNWCDQEQRRQR
ncbi:MAG: hypothetical protein IJ146_12435 [Kiritimatiellae bacterium]|nr:hypothetical protein [Kiritimatiellia bacterium]